MAFTGAIYHRRRTGASALISASSAPHMQTARPQVKQLLPGWLHGSQGSSTHVRPAGQAPLVSQAWPHTVELAVRSGQVSGPASESPVVPPVVPPPPEVVPLPVPVPVSVALPVVPPTALPVPVLAADPVDEPLELVPATVPEEPPVELPPPEVPA